MWAGQFYSRGAYTIFHHTRAENTTFAFLSRERKWHFRAGYGEKVIFLFFRYTPTLQTSDPLYILKLKIIVLVNFRPYNYIKSTNFDIIISLKKIIRSLPHWQSLPYIEIF